MKILEIIHLRMAGASTDKLVDVVRNSVGCEPDLSDVRVCRHAKLETDRVVHLHRAIADRFDIERWLGRGGMAVAYLRSLVAGYGELCVNWRDGRWK